MGRDLVNVLTGVPGNLVGPRGEKSHAVLLEGVTVLLVLDSGPLHVRPAAPPEVGALLDYVLCDLLVPEIEQASLLAAEHDHQIPSHVVCLAAEMERLVQVPDEIDQVFDGIRVSQLHPSAPVDLDLWLVDQTSVKMLDGPEQTPVVRADRQVSAFALCARFSERLRLKVQFFCPRKLLIDLECPSCHVDRILPVHEPLHVRHGLRLQRTHGSHADCLVPVLVPCPGHRKPGPKRCQHEAAQHAARGRGCSFQSWSGRDIQSGAGSVIWHLLRRPHEA
mmetsp:Transcript_15097/g.39943  ORF Transcript_15097/g.39943 Transcript_15097/m.39943 type:complete len:278 (-) Transcript_15097:57-890(-)